MKKFKVMRRSPLDHWEFLFDAPTRYACQKLIAKLPVNTKINAPYHTTTRSVKDFRARNI